MTQRALAPLDTPTLTNPSDKVQSPLTELGCCDTGCKPVETLDQASRRALWDVQLLEAGIVFHSIMMCVPSAHDDVLSVSCPLRS